MERKSVCEEYITWYCKKIKSLTTCMFSDQIPIPEYGNETGWHEFSRIVKPPSHQH